MFSWTDLYKYPYKQKVAQQKWVGLRLEEQNVANPRVDSFVGSLQSTIVLNRL